jgi:hypothetical protein
MNLVVEFPAANDEVNWLNNTSIVLWWTIKGCPRKVHQARFGGLGILDPVNNRIRL